LFESIDLRTEFGYFILAERVLYFEIAVLNFLNGRHKKAALRGS